VATRRKLSRKELKQPDEFQSIFETVGDFVEENLTRVLLGVGAVLGLVAIGAVVYSYAASKTRLAAERFSQALDELQNNQYGAAEADLRSLADDEPRREVGRLARFYLASAYLAQNQPAEARDELQTYLAHDNPSLFRDAALNDLAVAYENLGDYKRAEDAYRRAAALQGPGQERAQLGVARMLQKEGRRAEAIAAYRDFLSQHPFASGRENVMETLASLGVAPPSTSNAPTVRVIQPATVPSHPD
jgi:tetratricopeptide (TPR) repeat protein